MLVLEIVALLVIVALVLWVLIPALVDALQFLAIAVVYMSVVISAFAITTSVFVALFFEPDELDLAAVAQEFCGWLKARCACLVA